MIDATQISPNFDPKDFTPFSDPPIDEPGIPALFTLLRDRIAASGPISFADFMDAALYHPELGYYSSGDRRVIGPEGDYLTSPEVHPLFPAVIGRWLRLAWSALGAPACFVVREWGPGNGTLAAGLLSWSARHPELARALSVELVERAPAMRARQERALRPWAQRGRARWDASGPLRGVLLANELLDAMPVHRVRRRDGRLEELRVGLNEGRFTWSPAPATDPGILAYLEWLGVEPPEGATVELWPGLPAWARARAAELEEGFLLLLDYGDRTERLYAAWRREGTLLCFRRHAAHDDPFRFVGEQDITAHVDFGALGRALRESGLRVYGPLSQAEFLRRLGIGQALAPEAAAGLSFEALQARREAIAALTDAAGLGRVRVLAAARGPSIPPAFTAEDADSWAGPSTIERGSEGESRHGRVARRRRL